MENNIIETYGKIPPQDTNLEKIVLGALLIDNNAINDVMGLISAETFYNPQHQTIFKAILKLNVKGVVIDMLTVVQELESNNHLESVGGVVYIAELSENVATSAHLETHCAILQQKYIRRQLIHAGCEMQKISYDESMDVDVVMNKSEIEFFAIMESSMKKDTQSISDIAKRCIEELEERAKKMDRLIGLPTGFSELDRVTAGLQSPDLIVVAGRPAMGKTAFCMGVARNTAVDFKNPVAVFSLEMADKQLGDRLIAAESGVELEKYRTGQLADHEWQSVERCVPIFEQAPIFIDDTPGISIYELRSKARKLKRLHGIKLIVIDYIQLMTVGTAFNGNREQEVSFITRSLKELAKELDIPIIALSQLNRSVESRGGDKRPQLSDLRESGAIEQDADMVLFLHRPEYYGMLEDNEGNSTQGKAEIVIAKYRNGATGIINVGFTKKLAKFHDIISNIDEFAVASAIDKNDIPQNNDFANSESREIKGNAPF